MYGINGYDEEDLQKLLGFNLPQTENFQAQQPPQLEQGLLGNTTQPNQQQASKSASQMAQIAQSMNQSAGDNGFAQRQASTQQAMQQALAQQQQQQAQSGQILGTLLKMYLTGGAGA